jgi:hypothetical protein
MDARFIPAGAVAAGAAGAAGFAIQLGTNSVALKLGFHSLALGFNESLEVPFSIESVF